MLGFDGFCFAVSMIISMVNGSVSHDQTLMCWRLDLQSQRLDCWRTGGGHQRPIECVAADANGQLVATGGADNLVNVWPAAPDADPVTISFRFYSFPLP